MTAVAAPVRERPILFSGEMVRAILEGRKTQTRRVVKLRPGGARLLDRYEDGALLLRGECPYGQPGDRLWVRETWGYDWYDDGQTRAWQRVVYRADPGAQALDQGQPVPWCSPIHMPRSASRLTLELTDVRVEQLQDISEADAQAEGLHSDDMLQRARFRDLWDRLNAKRAPWESNPWVWVLEFRRAEVSHG